MKKYTKLAAIMMLVVLFMSLGSPIQAEENEGSITVKEVVQGRVVELYKILDLTYNGSHVSYTIDSDWTGFFSGTGASFISDTDTGSLNPIVINGVTKYIHITEDNAEEFSDAALEYALKLEPDAAQTASSTEMTFEGLDLGYYLIYPVGASELSSGSTCICSLDSTVPDATVYVKAVYPSISKSEVTSVVSAEVGQKIEYVIKGEVPNTTGYTKYTYIIRDTMTNLAYNKDFVMTVGGNTIEGSLYTLSETNDGFVVTLDVMNMQELRGSEIRISYSGSVKEAAVVDGAKNNATLTYSSNPDKSLETLTTPSDEQKVYSSQIIIDKQDSDTGRKLAGASFVLKNGEGQYYQYNSEEQKVSWTVDKIDALEFTSDDMGYAKILGLADGTYYLTETQAPDGYNKLTEDVVIQVQGDEENNLGASYTAVVKNKGGVELPSTGGMGTKIFYTTGCILIGIALISMFVSKKSLKSKRLK